MGECAGDEMSAGVFMREGGVTGVGVAGHGRVEGVVVLGNDLVDAVVLDGDAWLEDWSAGLAKRDG